MRVYNLSNNVQVYKGVPIKPYGSAEVPVDFVPDRDRANKNLSFGELPKGWKPPAPKSEPTESPSAVVAVAPPEAKAQPAPKEGWKKKRY